MSLVLSLFWVANSRTPGVVGNHNNDNNLTVLAFLSKGTLCRTVVRLCISGIFFSFFFFFLNLVYIKGFPGGSDGKESACNVGDPGSIPGSGKSLGKLLFFLGGGRQFFILLFQTLNHD